MQNRSIEGEIVWNISLDENHTATCEVEFTLKDPTHRIRGLQDELDIYLPALTSIPIIEICGRLFTDYYSRDVVNNRKLITLHLEDVLNFLKLDENNACDLIVKCQFHWDNAVKQLGDMAEMFMVNVQTRCPKFSVYRVIYNINLPKTNNRIIFLWQRFLSHIAWMIKRVEKRNMIYFIETTEIDNPEKDLERGIVKYTTLEKSQPGKIIFTTISNNRAGTFLLGSFFFAVFLGIITFLIDFVLKPLLSGH